MDASDIAVYIGAAGAILGALLVIARVVVKLTPSPKDDQIVAAIGGIVDAVLRSAADRQKSEDAKNKPAI